MGFSRQEYLSELPYPPPGDLPDPGIGLAYIAGLVIIFIFCRIFIKPIRWLVRLLINSVLGGLILAAVNFVGGFAGITVIINPITSMIAGLLGVPGVILVVILQYII